MAAAALALALLATVQTVGPAAIELPAIHAPGYFGACGFSKRSAIVDASDGESLHGL